MTALPAWTNTEWARDVAEPFRSDHEFWSSLAASVDALVGLLAAVVIGVGLTLLGARFWALLPFVVPAGLAARGAMIGRSSSRRSRESFSDRRSWRDAERTAVASVFVGVLRRPRRSSH